ncbi:hypothetical protein LTR37_013839 [Vermiconidia calcicola]|uniref:Uncharacterized protein n=1 Tax=Vermiconidia calcicola TaxID=1690605 RepID=A0ACC3MVH6_9PEZI|nr:hypothetical protein LTR37_013839 [Vermiconidia calcicola]
MADSTAATTLLDELLSSGRLTTCEFDKLNAVCQKLAAEDDIQIPGNVTLRVPCRRKIEPVSRVLNTPELLEHILAQMLPSDLLLRAQLVCKGFRDAIDSSVRLRRLLYREPDFNRIGVEPLPYQLCGKPPLPSPGYLFSGYRLCNRNRPCLMAVRIKNWDILAQHDSARGLLIAQPPQTKVTIIVDMGGEDEQ